MGELKSKKGELKSKKGNSTVFSSLFGLFLGRPLPPKQVCFVGAKSRQHLAWAASNLGLEAVFVRKQKRRKEKIGNSPSNIRAFHRFIRFGFLLLAMDESLLDVLSGLHATTLFADEWACKGILRILPPVARSYTLRMMAGSGAVDSKWAGANANAHS